MRDAMTDDRIERSHRHSYIGEFANSNFVYAMQYERAFEILYLSNESVDRIALPMLYSLRHYIEVILKYNIDYFHEYSGSNSMVNKTEHKLVPLANAFKEHWTIVVKKFSLTVAYDEKYFSELFKLIDKLNNLDKYSTSFRYSHDKNNQRQFDRLKTIDIRALKTLLDDVKPLLLHSIDVFDDKTGLMHGKTTKKKILEGMT